MHSSGLAQKRKRDYSEFFGEPCIIITRIGAKYIGMITCILGNGDIDTKVMFTDRGDGWELAGAPWRKRFTEPVDVWLIDE